VKIQAGEEKKAWFFPRGWSGGRNEWRLWYNSLQYCTIAKKKGENHIFPFLPYYSSSDGVYECPLLEFRGYNTSSYSE
jgi:hypothetical protein